MKAAISTAYGGPEVIQVQEVPRPEPKPGEVLIRIRATTVSAADWRIRSLNVPRGFGLLVRLIFGVTKPRKPILGTEACGEVVALGEGVTGYAPGDHVVIFTGGTIGCHAEYRAMPTSGAIIPKPAGLTVEEAAAMSFGGTTALFFLRDQAKLRPGERVLVIGASGAVGSAAVQIARAMGASVTGVTSAGNVDLVRGLGADRVIDYTRADFTASGDRWDVILDTVGGLPFAKARKVLSPEGRVAMAVFDLSDLPAMLGNPFRRQKAIGGTTGERAEDLAHLARLAEAGQYRPVIDSTYPFDQIARAHARVDSRRKRGSVVVTLG